MITNAERIKTVIDGKMIRPKISDPGWVELSDFSIEKSETQPTVLLARINF